MKKPANLVFEDNFERLDKSVWSLRNRPVPDIATADWRAVRIYNSKLRLLAKPDPDNPGKWLNGHIGTANTFEFTYGYVESRMKFHPYEGSFAASWLQSKAPYTPNNPELNIAEYMGKKNPLGLNGSDMLHNVYTDSTAEPQFRSRTNDLKLIGKRWWETWNTFGMLWTPQGYEWYINDQLVAGTDIGASSSPKYLVLSMITRDWSAPRMRLDQLKTYKLNVDWIRVFQD